MTPFGDQLADHIDAGLDVDTALDKALAEADPADVYDYVRPYLREMARRRQRSQTRRIENTISARRPVAPQVATNPRHELLARGFALPTGEVVQWDLATAAQHRERAGWQRSQAARLNEDAKRHERAADEIEAAGVTCLADLVGATA